jgi:hypothetical protein
MILVGTGLVFALLLAVSPALAQITTGTVSGTVKDAQGGVIPGATVVLISESRGTTSAPAVTNETGIYVFRTSRRAPTRSRSRCRPSRR